MSERGDGPKVALTGAATGGSGDVASGGGAPREGTGSGSTPGSTESAADSIVGREVLRSLIRSHHEARRRERVEAFETTLVESLVSAGGIPAQLAVDELFAEAVFQGYRRTMEASAPAAVAPIARLTALFGQQGPTPFFRRCGRFLRDAFDHELDALRAVLVRSAEQVPDATDHEQILHRLGEHARASRHGRRRHRP